MSRLIRFFRSPRLSVALFLVLGGLMLLGLLVPQKDLLRGALYSEWKQGNPAIVSVLEALGLTEVYTSPLLLAAWALFFVNLTFVMGQRWKTVRAKLEMPIDPGSSSLARGAPFRRTFGGSKRDLGRVAGLLRLERCEVLATDSAIYAVKNRWSPVATLLFHFSFFLVLTGAIVSSWTRFSATAVVAERESFAGVDAIWATRPISRRFARPPEARFLVEKVTPVARGETALDMQAQIRNEEGRSFLARVNHPYKVDHTSFVILDLGVAPLLVLEDSSGREVDGAFVKLPIGGRTPERFLLGGVRMEGAFHSDYVVEEGIEGSRSKEFRNPVLSLRVVPEGETSGVRRALRPGEALEWAGGRVVFREFRYAVKFFVRRERGVLIVYFGFLLACVGLVWRLVFYRREFQVRPLGDEEGGALELSGRGEYYQALFEEELEALAGRLESGLVQGILPADGTHDTR